MQKWWEKVWQQKRYKEYIPLQKLKMEIKQEGVGWKHKSDHVFTKHNIRSIKVLHSHSSYILVKTKNIVYNTYMA